MEALELARTIVDAIEEKKGEDILLMDLIGVVSFTDYFVICTGTSERMLKALLDAALDEVRKRYKVKPRVEGRSLEGWILADYGDVIVHVFSVEQREFYALEELWGEGKILLHLQ